ncbi:MAG TPA: V-type ATP synthase subunit A [Candidatus Korarchaeota archaeon]|nr:V-type ATP synthase subunit A [Candidatus Korarchaeota archaeon]
MAVEQEVTGVVSHIKGPIVIADGMRGARIREIVLVGEERLIGEIVRIEGDKAVIQVYEPTEGMRPGEPVERTGEPLSAELGPGLLGQVLDGLGRPLPKIAEMTGQPFITRGIKLPTLPRDVRWHFKPTVEVGERVVPGDVLGTVPEGAVTHKIMVPPNAQPGRIVEIVPEGDYTVEEVIAVVESAGGVKQEIKMYHKWPVRMPRPFREKLEPTMLLVTGQRVIDTFFPIVKGGASAIPGGFGTGKTVTLHQVSKWADADVVVYVGCGERGNEMTDLLQHFPKLIDPKTGRPLLERSVLIANTSNMPVPAREASIFIGITYAEYYRDMGLDVVLTADSTSRWAEALRELSSRLEEIPSERGFPAYLPDYIASFYERAGRIKVLGRRDEMGSVAVIGAVSPSGGDLNEPVTQHTMRYVGAFWALDKDLAFKRHFPAINWLKSFSKYAAELKYWWIENTGHDMMEYRERAMEILQKASSLEEVARVVGEAALSDENRLVLLAAEMIREGFLVQNAYHEVDTYCSPKKQAMLLKALVEFYDRARPLVEAGVPMSSIREMSSVGLLMRLKFVPEDKFEEALKEALTKLETEASMLMAEVR